MSYKKCIKDLENCLAPYGYYFSRKDQSDANLFIFSDIGLIAISILAWSLHQYFKAFLQEKGKIDANRISRNLNQGEKDKLIEHIDELISEIKKMNTEHHEKTNNLLDHAIKIDLIEEFLVNHYGISKRKSLNLSRDLTNTIKESLPDILGR